MKKEILAKNQKRSNNMMIAGLILMVVMAVSLVVLFVNGEIGERGSFPEPESVVSATCVSETIDYPYFSMNEADRKELNIKIVSSGDKVDTISLVYRLYYSSEEAVTGSRDVNHYAMNKAFEAVDMEADSLGATYSKLIDNFRFNLFAKSTRLNDTTKKFFLLNDVESEGGFNYEKVKKVYVDLGFTCVDGDS